MLLLPVEGYVESAGHFSASDTASYMFQGPCKNQEPKNSPVYMHLTAVNTSALEICITKAVEHIV